MPAQKYCMSLIENEKKKKGGKNGTVEIEETSYFQAYGNAI